MADRRLTMEEAEHIRARHARGEMTVRQAADAYGLGIESVRRLLRRETYRHAGRDEYGRDATKAPDMDVAAAESAKRFLEMQATAPRAQAPNALDLFLAATAKAKSDACAGDDFVESLLASEKTLTESAPKTGATEPGGPPADESEF